MYASPIRLPCSGLTVRTPVDHDPIAPETLIAPLLLQYGAARLRRLKLQRNGLPLAPVPESQQSLARRPVRSHTDAL